HPGAYRYPGEKTRQSLAPYRGESGTKTKPVHLPDVAIQLYVAEGSGLQISKAGILHLNGEYVRKGELDLDALFHFEDLTKQARAQRPKVVSKLRGLRVVLDSDEVPDIEPGPHCWDPWDCPFTDHCIEPMEPYAIGQLPRSEKLV